MLQKFILLFPVNKTTNTLDLLSFIMHCLIYNITNLKQQFVTELISRGSAYLFNYITD